MVSGWWFGTWLLFFHFIYGMSSFPLTNNYFSRWLKPPTRSTVVFFHHFLIIFLLDSPSSLCLASNPGRLPALLRDLCEGGGQTAWQEKLGAAPSLQVGFSRCMMMFQYCFIFKNGQVLSGWIWANWTRKSVFFPVKMLWVSQTCSPARRKTSLPQGDSVVTWQSTAMCLENRNLLGENATEVSLISQHSRRMSDRIDMDFLLGVTIRRCAA